MIVAASAAHGQRLSAAHHDIDPIVDDVVRVVQESTPQRQESHCRQGSLVVAEFESIGGQLFDQKAVVGKILVERANNVVPVGVRERIPPLFLEHVSLGVRIAGHVQPMASPTLTVPR